MRSSQYPIEVRFGQEDIIETMKMNHRVSLEWSSSTLIQGKQQLKDFVKTLESKLSAMSCIILPEGSDKEQAKTEFTNTVAEYKAQFEQILDDVSNNKKA